MTLTLLEKRAKRIGVPLTYVRNGNRVAKTQDRLRKDIRKELTRKVFKNINLPRDIQNKILANKNVLNVPLYKGRAIVQKLIKKGERQIKREKGRVGRIRAIEPMTNAEKNNAANWLIDNTVPMSQKEKEDIIYYHYIIKRAPFWLPSYVLKYVKHREDHTLFLGFQGLVRRIARIENIPNNLRPKWKDYKKFARLNNANKNRVVRTLLWKFVYGPDGRGWKGKDRNLNLLRRVKSTMN